METLLPKSLKQERILISVFLLSILPCFSLVKAITVSPPSITLTLEKGKEMKITKYIQVLNSAPEEVHVVCGVSGSISKFITLDPKEFDLPAGPGAHSKLPRPYKYVKVTFRIPREIEKSEYDGLIMFKERISTRGMLQPSIENDVKVELKVGKVAEAEFPPYVNVLVLSLLILLVFSILKKEK